MRKLMQFLTRRWVLILIGVLALSLLVWFVGPLVAVAERKPLESQVSRFIVILLLLLGWGLDNLRVRAKDRRTSEQLSQELVPAPDPEAARSAAQAAEVDAEQAVLSQKLRDALKTLQRAQLAKGQRLYQLPWYVIIGAPGSGKTTALKNSGLRFPLESQLGDNPVQGAGGTRYCDWWFTDEAILLDTAGRYTTQDNPKESAGRAWLGFLAALKKSRPKRPLNGIIVAVSVLDVLSKTSTQQAMQATAIKRRIQELNNHLDMDLPVYVVFTKCDLIAGFNEFFADLEKEEREQVWGISFPLGKPAATGAALESFPGQFEALLTRANDRLLHRLSAEPDANRRALIFEFPRQMLSLQDKLHVFLKDIFIPNQFEQPSLLRGVYFVSGTQTGNPGQWVSGVLPPSLCAPAISAAATAAPKSFFLAQLLQQVIFGEAHLASSNLKAERRFRWAYAATLAAVCLAFVGSATAWFVSHRGNTAYLAQVRAKVEDYRGSTGGGLSERRRDWLALAGGLTRLQALPTGYVGGPQEYARGAGFGLYQGEKVGAQARWVYLKALERYFMPTLSAELLRQVSTSAENDDRLYEALRFYLMLYYPEKMDRKGFELWSSLLWERLFPGEAHATLREQLLTHLRVALDEGVPPLAMDRERVGQARQWLAKTPLERRIYRRLRNEYLEKHLGEFNVEGVLGRKAQALFYRRSGEPLDRGVPKLFSYPVFHTEFNVESKQIARRLAEERWIYGDSGPAAIPDAELAAVGERVLRLYFEEYIARWSALLEDLAVKRFADPADGRVVASVLAGGDAPLVTLLKAIRKHTALAELPEGSQTAAKVAAVATENVMVHQRRRLEGLLPAEGEGVGLALPGQPVSDAFQAFNDYATEAEGLPLQRLQSSFAGLNQYLEALAESDNLNQAAFNVSRDPEQGAAAIKETRSALAAAPKPVREWFASVPADAEGLTRRGTQAHANDVWSAEVLPFYEKAIKGRYPVDPQATAEIRIDDFIRFFGPKGILDSYFQSHIKPFVDTGGRKWRWRKPVGMSQRTLALFQRAKRIEEAYFKGPEALEIGFTLKPYTLHPAVTRALVEAGGSQLSYDHGPVRSSLMSWPGSRRDESRLVFTLASQGTPVSVRADGDWSWFRLLDRYARTERLPGDNGVLVTFSVQGLEAQYELRPERLVNPFARQDIHNFRLPKKL